MSVVPAALFLVDFGNNDPSGESAGETVSDPALLAAAEAADAAAEAYARGLDEGRQAAQAEAAAELEAQRAAAEQSLAEAREGWCSEQSARIAEQIGTAIGEMEQRIAEAAERILRPFMAQAVRDQAIGELRTILLELVGSNPDMALEICGPEDLLEKLREGLSGTPVTAAYAPGEACDVRVRAGASIIETRIAAWLKAYEGQPA